MAGDCQGNECASDANSSAISGGLPYLILIITLVLCSILLATIALIIIVVVTRHRKKRQDSMEDTAISYDDLAKPGMTAMEVQPDMRNLEPRGDPRAYMPFAPLPPRRFGPQAQFDSQRRLITVPEEEGSADEGRHSQENLLRFAAYDYNNGNLGDVDEDETMEDEGETQQGAAAAPIRQMRQAGFLRGKQRALSNSGT